MDPYQSPDSQDSAVISAIIDRLEDRGENLVFNGYIDQYLGSIELEKLTKVLDLGCGTGVVTRRISTNLPYDCQLTGADISKQLLAVAKQRSSLKIDWIQACGEELPFEDGCFDLVVMHTLLTHVEDPVRVLREARRVLAESGTIIIFDADYASTTYAISDFEKGKRIDQKLFRAVVNNLDVCRVMPRYIKEAGLLLESHQGHVLSEAGKGDFWLSSIKGFEKLIPALDILEPAEGVAWVKEMLAHHDSNTFFASGNYYTYFVKKS